MKVRVSVLALLMSVLPALVFAYPGIGGGKGLLRVQNALVEDEAGLTISLHALARNPLFETPVAAPNSSGWVADLIAPELSYAPVVTKYAGFELFGSWGGVFQTPKSSTEDGFIWGFHDLKAGGKLSIPIIPVLKLGGTASYTFLDREVKDGWTVLDPTAVVQADKLAWAGLVTLQFQDVMKAAPNIMFNYGKVADETRYGAGVELQGTGFGLFLEALSQQPNVGSSGIFDTDNGHIHLTPGVALGSVSSSVFKLAYTFSFGNDASGIKQPNELILGVSFATPFGKRAPAEYGTITGTVADEKTGAALTANVDFPENENMASFTTDATGVFEVKKVRTGVTVVEVSADGYNKQTVPLAVEKDQVVNYQFKLRPLKTYGTIAGTVIDAVSSAPLAARIEFPGTALAPVNAGATSGAFKVDKVETGVYTLTASADKHIPATITVAVEDNKLATATFKLSPVEAAVAVTGRVYDKKTDASLSATVTFNNVVYNTDPATGVYKAQLMAGSYTVVIESKDYVKQTVAMVVEKGKPTVRNFELVKEGMSITLKGIYFDFNQATIKPESRPALEDAAKILKDNPTINVEIQGHTDSKGSDEYNLSLSDKRAWAVVNYLVQNFGIAMNRLTAKGYGEARPIATNETDSGRALNRRVEFVILGQQ
ncbi:OmpA family protein [candidate division WOR-3 bacterium]|nr:OmpA family protein [candidate division WOR-3 bacterium]